MKLKEIFSTIGIAIAYDLIGCLLYMLLMFLFAWMSHWWWFFIVVVGIGDLAILIGFSQMYSLLLIPLCNNIIGKVLAISIAIHLSYFSINAVWNADFLSDPSKEIAVKILATIVFCFTYVTAIPFTISYKNKLI